MKAVIRFILYSLCVVTAVYLVIQVVSYNRYVNSQDEQVLRTAQATTDAINVDVDALLQSVEQAGEELGQRFAQQDFTDEEVRALIKQVSLDYPEISGVTACYTPFGFSEDKRLYCPYYNKRTESVLNIEESYDYTIKGSGTAWYNGVVEKGKTWTNPYYGAAAQSWFVDYGVPFYYSSGPKKGQVRGIVDFAIEVGDFKKIIHSLSVGRTGYGFINTENGLILSHPIADYVGTKTLQDLREMGDRPELVPAYDALLAGESGHYEFIDQDSGDAALIVYDKIATANYGIAMVFFKQDLMDNQRKRNQRYIKMALTLSLLFVLALTLYFGRDILDRTEIEVISVLATFLLIANVSFVGFLQHGSVGFKKENDSPPIIDTITLGNFVEQQNARSETLKIAKPIVVPTGLYVETIEFEDSYNVNIGGTVWQKYPLGAADDLTIGFRFPQISPFAEASMIEESYRETVTGKEGEEGYLLVGWDYRVTLRLNLKYADFPFDKRHLDIKISPLSLEDNLLFVPDLGSYQYTTPAKLAGLNPKITLSGNEITRSYFNFSIETYDSTFGYESKTAFENVPVLHFNVHIRRLLLNAFVTYLIPIFVALSLIYILIMACSKTEARQGIIESMAAFFFVLIFSHIDLRKDIETADLIFMEYIYFTTYILIVLSTLNLMAYTKSKTSLFDFNENQIYRVVYFPIFFTAILVVMLAKFY